MARQRQWLFANDSTAETAKSYIATAHSPSKTKWLSNILVELTGASKPLETWIADNGGVEQ